MKRKIITLLIVLLLLTVSAGIVSGIEQFNEETIYVNDDADSNWYDATHVKTIQEGLDNASAHDTIFVYNGIYIENIVIDKTLTLTGEDKNKTIIDGDYKGNSIEIIEKDVTINGFTIKNSGRKENEAGIVIHSNGVLLQNNKIICNGRNGISLFSASNCTITQNILENNRYDGVYLSDESNFNKISKNLIINHSRDPFDCHGIYIRYSSNNLLLNNTLSNNAGYDFFLIATTSLILQGNIFMDSSGIFFAGGIIDHWNTHKLSANMVDNKPVYFYANVNAPIEVPQDAGQVILANCSNMKIQHLSIHNGDCAVLLGFSNKNAIKNNNISNVIAGVWLTASSNNDIIENTIGNVGGSIPLAGKSNFNNIQGNTISDNWEYGIGLWSGSSCNMIHENKITENKQPGIILSSSSFNIIKRNSFEDNSWYGAYLTSASFNRFEKNNFINHKSDVFFENSFFNSWSQNYWDTYDGTGPMILTGENTLPWNSDKTIDWKYYDWRPAKEPYEIEVK